MCDDCTIIRNRMRTVNPLSSEHIQSNSQLLIHLIEYRKCREVYETDIHSARQSSISTSERSLNTATRCHSFDFQQVVEIPHIPQQSSQWYSWSPFKVYVFGIVNEETNQHYHSLYTEAQIEKACQHGRIPILPASFIDEKPDGFFRNWDQALSRFMRPIGGIQKFQLFRFEVGTEPGLVRMTRLSEDN